MEARGLRRTPVLLALLVFLPAYMIGVFTVVAPDSAARFEVAGGEVVRTSLTDAFPAFTTPMVAALLSGIAGLFLMQTATDADARLAITGYSAHEIVLTRLVVLGAISALGTTVAVGAMWLTFEPTHLVWFSGAVFLAALTYGMCGVLAGIALDRLPGVYVVLFGSMIDLFVFQNPVATDPPAAATLLPGHYPLEVAMAAAFGDTIPVDAVGWSVFVLLALTGMATAAFYCSLRAS
jgi:hypothetical protein